jgi:GNAT superfamily N-acetyltransferase
MATTQSDLVPANSNTERPTVSSSGPANRDHFLPGRIPEELHADVIVTTGAVFHLRPIRAEDAEKLVAFHACLSFDSIYRRYFSLHPTLTADEVRHFTNVDYVDRLALVIEDGDQLVAVGRYDRYPNSPTAEVAFVVRDDYQHLGLGHLLLDALARAAWERGITTLCAETLFTNHDMMSVFRHSGFPITTSAEFGEISVRLAIDPRLCDRHPSDVVSSND